MERIKNWVRSEAVLLIAAVCALVSAFIIPFDWQLYSGYINFSVLCQLFCLMAVVAGFQKIGVFAVLSYHLLLNARNLRFLSLVLVALPFFSSMLITNDVALITFVPFAVTVLTLTGQTKHMIYIIVLQTVAANLGSMLLPVGNPQNLYLYAHFELSIGTFFRIMVPLVGLSLLLLGIGACMVPGRNIRVAFPEPMVLRDRKELGIYIFLFLICLCSVFRMIHYLLAFGIVVVVLLLFQRKLFRYVDYGLLATFVCFFIFAGNMGRIPVIEEGLEYILQKQTMLTAILASQVISNVPAAVLLSGFTENAGELLLGTNIGGLGTLIASLASLISFKLYVKTEQAKPLRYLGMFTAVNVIFLVVLCTAALL